MAKTMKNMGFVVCRCLYRSFGTKGGACLMFHVGICIAVLFLLYKVLSFVDPGIC